jgi:magnesium transporter
MTNPSPIEQLRALLPEADAGAIHAFLANLPPSETPHVLSRLSDDEQTQVLAALPPEEAARLVEELPLSLAATMLHDVSPVAAAAILDRLPSDEQTDLLAHLDAEQSAAVLAQMAPEEAADVHRLRDYPPETAGGLMVTEYLAYPDTALVGEVLADLRTHADRYAQYPVQYAYGVSPQGKLSGVVRLRDLLFSGDKQPLRAVLQSQPAAARVDAGLSELRAFFERHRFLAAPILDGEGRLVGVVSQSDVEEAAAEQAEHRFLRLSGIVSGEEFRTMPLATRVAGRLAWLAVTMLLSFLAASVVGLFEDTLSQVIALAVFLPVISGMSGNAGNQAIAVTMRELSLGLLKPHELQWVILKEASVGVINGLVLGLVMSLVAWFWKGNPYLGLAVGGAQALSVLAAACLGGGIPLMLKRFSLDPALASAPILTTITDATGFFLALGLARLMLPLLV